MVRRFAILLALLTPHCLAAAIAIRNVTVIDGTGAPPRPLQTVIVRGSRITQIGASARVRIPAGAKIIEGRGRYLIPGLWDMHIHLTDARNPLPLYAARGVTGVRDMGSDLSRTRMWRSAIEAGKQVGPHVVTSGPAVDGRAARNPRMPVMVALTPEEGRRTLDYLDEREADLVSVLSDLPRDTYVALAERARKWRMPFGGDVPSSVSLIEAIEARQSSVDRFAGAIEAFSLDPARAMETFIEDRARDTFQRSALMGTRHVPILRSWAREGGRRFEHAARMIRLMRDSGAEIMAGTDTGEAAGLPGAALHEELELLVKAGLTPMQALQSATAIPARFLNWQDATGLLKPNMVADMVLLDANPLADIRNVSRVSGVFARGRYLAPAWIKATLNQVR